MAYTMRRLTWLMVIMATLIGCNSSPKTNQDSGEAVEPAVDPSGEQVDADVRPIIGRIAHTLEHPGVIVRSAAFSPDGKQIVTAGDDGAALVWDIAME